MEIVKKRKNKKIVKTMLIIFMIIIVIILSNNKKTKEKDSKYETVKVESTNYSKNVENIKEESQNLADVIENVTKSVVGISKLKNTGDSILGNNDEGKLGLGTGIIVSSNGYILSNEHLTGERFSKCYVTLDDGKKYDGTVVWSDKDFDLSIIQINVKDLPKVNLGDSNSIRVGESVYAIGNPIGFEFRRTVTSGIISAKNRTIKIEDNSDLSYMTDLIQTDATINPGNSGGPLINPNGEVIGINTVKITSAEGIGFAVPINLVKSIIKSFDEQNKFNEATIGILGYDKEVIPYLTSSSINFNKGIYIVKIIANSSVSNTELKEGDIINSIDNLELNTMNELKEYIYTKKPGDEVILNINRGKINKKISVKLGKK